MGPLNKIVVDELSLDISAVQNVFDMDVHLQCTIALLRQGGFVKNVLGRYREVMPMVHRIGQVSTFWNGTPELDLFAVDVVTPITIVIAHPLCQVLQVTLIGLQDSLHHGTVA